MKNLIFRKPRGYYGSCGSINADQVQAASDRELGMAAKLEAVLMLAMGMTGDDGRRVIFVIPPALALAVIRVVESADPCGEADRILRGGPK